jgi:hypothetical protein
MLLDDIPTTSSEPSAAVLAPGQAPHPYCWPVWRFGHVLETKGGEKLRVETAQEIGGLFKAGRPSLIRYLQERLDGLRRLARECGGRLLEEWPAKLERSPAIQALQNIWRAAESWISYSFVPIVRLPHRLLELGPTLWHVRESLTVCGDPAKSKVWFTASLIALRGAPTDLVPLTRSDLDSAREHLGRFMKGALEGLVAYYLKVLNEDTAKLSLPQPVCFESLEILARTEIASLAASMDLRAGFDLLDEQGMTRLREEAGQQRFAGSQEILDFLDWTDWLGGGPRGNNWVAGRPKLLAIYADNPSCGSVRALVIPRMIPAENRTWYTLLTEIKEKPEGKFPLSESACRFTAREYGRYF